MGKYKNIITGTVTIVISAILMQSSPTYAIGSVPTECARISLSNQNPANDPVCNVDGNECITYCKAYDTGAKVNLPQDINQIKISYKLPPNTPVYITIPELGIENERLFCTQNPCVGTLQAKIEPAQTGTEINPIEQITIKLEDADGLAIGFRGPSENNVCGENNLQAPNRFPYGTVELTGIINMAEIDDYQVFSKQCWGDTPIGDADFDFNDYQIVMAGRTISAPVCGNGIIEEGETCDDGNTVSGDGCSATCQTENQTTNPVCGNGVVETGEQCDDGNTVSGDGCSATCQTEDQTTNPVCGNGVVEANEQCDDGNNVGGDGCTATCELEGEKGASICGNGIVETGETCDDGNTIGGDGCSATCQREIDTEDTAGGLLNMIFGFIINLFSKIASIF